MPADARAALARDGITLQETSFAGGMTEEETLVAFSALYDPTGYEQQPNAYAAEVVTSGDEGVLLPGMDVRVVHVSGVPQDAAAPADGTRSDDSIVMTDLFAFFEAVAGEHLATVYIGPPEAD